MLICNRAKSCNFKNLRIICMKQYENSLAHLYGNKLVQSLFELGWDLKYYLIFGDQSKIFIDQFHNFAEFYSANSKQEYFTNFTFLNILKLHS